MNNYLLLLIINIINVCFSNNQFNNDNSRFFSNHRFENDSYNIEEETDLDKNKNRELQSDDDGFTNIRIYIDKTYINQNYDNLEILNKVLTSIEKCVKSIEEIIKVRQIDKIKFTDSDIHTLGFNNNEINPDLLSTGEGISSDLIIFPKFEEFQQNTQLVLAIGKPVIFDSVSKRPIGAILSINKNLPSIPNSENYLNSVIIHQLTHILGFMYELFDKYEIGFSNVIKTDMEIRTIQGKERKEKKYIKSPRVVSYAKKYFNCENITGVELEDSSSYDDYNNSHWEARILLGEYMNSEVHTPEQAISGFTLALLEDSGWYKANYYTGGLMRFGKHQGCAFLYEDCEVNDNSKNKFKNDLFAVSAINDLQRTTCSSGRQSRCYIITNNKMSRGLHISGKEIADDCFVSDFDKDEEDLSFFVGSCNKGNGEYGTKIYYNNNYRGKNGNFPDIFGEEISDNSFCVLSSVVPLSLKDTNINEFNIYNGITHPICYPMFCTSKSLTIQIYNHYIVCPREGGIVEVKGDYNGYVHCPDYNLICTGTVMCNDLFECIEKHSLEKDDNFDYDYEIKTSQEKIDNEHLEQNALIGYELTNEENGKCPQFCRQCRENKKCFICIDNYTLVGFKEGDDNPIYCLQNSDLGNYYKNEDDNTYYLCPDNCLSCSNKQQCNYCDSMYKLKNDNSSCEEIIPNCKVLDSNKEKCEECKDNFYLIDDDKLNCHNESLDIDKYFTEDDGKTYINCSKVISNCDKCTERDSCLLCKDGYKFNIESKSCEEIVSFCNKYDINFELCEECNEGYYILNNDKSHCLNDTLDEDKYFTEDDGKSYTSCENAITNCIKCTGKNECLLCKEGYIFNENNITCVSEIPSCKNYDINYESCEECSEGYYLLNDDKLNCHNESLDKDKYYTEDEGKTFISCEKVIYNCEKCTGKNECILCKDGYIFNENNITCVSEIPSCKNYDINYESCEECSEGYYLLNDDKLNCHNESLDKDKYFTEDEGKTFISCEKVIYNCEKCEEREKCKKCKKDFELNNDGEECIPLEINFECNINIHYLEDENLDFLKEENIENLIELYENEYSHDYGQVEYYINKKYNYTITIFVFDYCTKDLLNIGGLYFNMTNISEHFLGEKLIICFITYNYRNIISFYENKKKIDIENNFSEKNLNYTIENNYTKAINNYYSDLLIEKIKEENIDVFSLENENLKDKCNSLDIGGIDIPVNIREKIFTNSYEIQEFICTDKNCVIESNNNQSFISKCNCNINNDFNYLFLESESETINPNQELLKSEINFNVYDYMTCLFQNFNTKELFSNISFYLSIVSILLEIFCFILYLSCKSNINYQKYITSSKPKIFSQETQENKNILNTEDRQRQTISERNSMGNPPKKHLIKYKYKWLNKPRHLNLENSHDEDLEVQSRDEANIENELKRKIKIYPFVDNNSLATSSYLDDSLFDTCDKKTETSKNRITIPISDEKLHIKTNIKIEPIQSNKNNPLPQIVTREQNARRKVRIHSIKNVQQENTEIKNKEEKIIKKFCEVYCDIICIKQQLINLFLCSKSLDRQSFIPTPMKIIRLIFLILLNIFINSIFINQNYFTEKYYYFNKKYNLVHEAEKDFEISIGDKINYTLNHCVTKILISFLICLIIQMIIGLLFYNSKKKIDELIELNNKDIQTEKNNKLLSKIKCLYITFFIVNFILIIFFCLFLIGFNIINKNSEIDFLIPSIITFILLQLISFFISIIIALIMFLGTKINNKKMINFAKAFLF